MTLISPAAKSSRVLYVPVGFGLSGMLQSILVRPLSMVFPRNLVYVTLFHTLHEKSKITQDKLKFFTLAFVAVFVYQVI